MYAGGPAGGGAAAGAALPLGARTPAYLPTAAGAASSTAAAAAAPAAAAPAPAGALPPLPADTIPWWHAGVRVDITAGSHAGRAGTIAVVLAGGATCRVALEGAAGGASAAVAVPTVDLRPQMAVAGEPCFFIQGAFAGTRGWVVSRTDEDDYVCRVVDLSEAGDVEFFTASALVRMADDKA
jgi:hypothetical protein